MHLFARPSDRYIRSNEGYGTPIVPPWYAEASKVLPPPIPIIGSLGATTGVTPMQRVAPPIRPRVENMNRANSPRTPLLKAFDSVARAYCSHAYAFAFALALLAVFVALAIAMEGYYRCWRWKSDPLGAAVLEYKRGHDVSLDPAVPKAGADSPFASAVHVQFW